MNWNASAVRNSEALNFATSEAVAAAYSANWRKRQAVSIPFARREDCAASPTSPTSNRKSPPR